MAWVDRPGDLVAPAQFTRVLGAVGSQTPCCADCHLVDYIQPAVHLRRTVHLFRHHCFHQTVQREKSKGGVCPHDFLSHQCSLPLCL